MTFAFYPPPYSQSQCLLEMTETVSLAFIPPGWVKCIPLVLLVQQGDANPGLELLREVQVKYRDQGVIPACKYVCIHSWESLSVESTIMKAMGRRRVIEAAEEKVQGKEEEQERAASREVEEDRQTVSGSAAAGMAASLQRSRLRAIRVLCGLSHIGRGVQCNQQAIVEMIECDF